MKRRLGKPLGYAAARRDDPALVSVPKGTLEAGATLCMRLGSTRICIFIVSGVNEQCPPKEIALAMATYNPTMSAG
jgi:hypothetical protein